MVDFGIILFKFWIQISADEQLRRFEERAADPIKNWKLTDEDWRNREKWDQYETAVNEMLLKTSTVTAPWTVVEGNDKWYARTKVLKTLVDKLSKELNYDPFEAPNGSIISKSKPPKVKTQSKKSKTKS
jgi:polyphosphate kinase 2 (PPK2 family)